ncbi:hypothetical protein N9D36_03180 [Gammaproteobacteria bacterium]|nr:hypothetical protein [Gammaproteobacteria bacterium]MDB4242849.1 hypothetical protein [Gammaproteobacteria bacterium]
MTLALVKVVSVFGGAGSLAMLGNIQNTLMIGSSIASFSTQTGVSSRIASGEDNNALKHAFHVTLFGSFLLLVIISISYILGIWPDLSVHWSLFVAASVGIGLNAIVAAALVAYQKLLQLVLLYFVTGTITLIWIVFSGSYDANSFGYGICLGSWLGAIAGFLHLPKNIIDLKARFSLLPQYLGLIKYGCASLVSVLTINSVIISARNSVLSAGDSLSGDIFEVGIRLNSLLDMFIIVPIATVMISSIAKENSSLGDAEKIYFYGLFASALISVSAALFLFFAGDLVVSLVFSDKFLGVLEYLHLIVIIQFFRCLSAAALLKQLIDGNIIFAICNDILYVIAFFMFMNFLPYYPGSLNLVFSAMAWSVFVYACLPIFFLVRSRINNAY